MPRIAVEPLFWLKAEVMVLKNSLQPLHAWGGGGEAGLMKRREERLKEEEFWRTVPKLNIACHVL